jgi:circadian clock protein KaiC
VDNVLYVNEAAIGLRALRYLRVQKSRGTPHVPGRHTFAIDNSGIHVFPRIEGLYRDPTQPVEEDPTRVQFNRADLDDLLGGGLLKGSSMLVLGPSGTGKTLLALTFLEAGLRRGEAGLYAGFYESPDRLIASGERIGLKLDEHVKSGLLSMQWQAPVELLLDAWAHRILDTVSTRNVSRLVIDGLNALQEGTAFADRFAPFLTALFNELRARGVTTITSTELQPIIGPSVNVPLPGVSPLVEGAILMRYVELQSRMQRVIVVLKLRGSEHGKEVRELRIGPEGLEVGASFGAAEALLTGTARQPTTVNNREPDAG